MGQGMLGLGFMARSDTRPSRARPLPLPGDQAARGMYAAPSDGRHRRVWARVSSWRGPPPSLAVQGKRARTFHISPHALSLLDSLPFVLRTKTKECETRRCEAVSEPATHLEFLVDRPAYAPRLCLVDDSRHSRTLENGEERGKWEVGWVGEEGKGGYHSINARVKQHISIYSVPALGASCAFFPRVAPPRVHGLSPPLRPPSVPNIAQDQHRNKMTTPSSTFLSIPILSTLIFGLRLDEEDREAHPQVPT
ncbi:hypothetical protein OF83DRAFT_891662 [Amylostereum chailletii]|nr:hypothetical protein OF83DRAFT_891662 [Amylostereum chailletii]